MSRYDSGSDNAPPVPRDEDLIAQGVPLVIMRFNEEGKTTCSEAYNLENVRIEKYAVESLARAIYPAVVAFYEDPENRAAFERWQAERQAKGIAPSKPKRHSRSRK